MPAVTFGRHENDKVTRGVRLSDGTEIVVSVLNHPVSQDADKLAIARMKLVRDTFNANEELA